MSDGDSIEERYEKLLFDMDAAASIYETDERYRGRLGILLSLRALVGFLANTEPTQPAEHLRRARRAAPLGALMAALADLDQGSIAPLLQPASAGNAPPLGLLTLCRRAQAAAALHALHKAGMTMDEAARAVLRALQHEEGEPSKSEAVKRWRYEMNEWLTVLVHGAGASGLATAKPLRSRACPSRTTPPTAIVS